MKVILSKEQSSWISRNFYKIADAQKDANKKRQIKRIADLCQASGSAVNLNKVQAGAIKSAVDVGLKALDSAENQYKKDVEKYKEYLERITEKRSLLKGILDKLVRAK